MYPISDTMYSTSINGQIEEYVFIPKIAENLKIYYLKKLMVVDSRKYVLLELIMYNFDYKKKNKNICVILNIF